MLRIRVLCVLSVSALAFGLGLFVTGPATAVPTLTQTIQFTSAAPTDADWAHTSSLGDYVPKATATSGLPVRFSLAPSTTACFAVPGVIGEPGSAEAGKITIYWTSPGTCTIYADQEGDGQYLPASRVVQTVEVHREPVFLTAATASKGLLGTTPTTFRADLRHEVHFGPGYILSGYPEQTITFRVGGKVMCSATTVFQGDGFDTTGVATCKAKIGLPAALKYFSYTASYAGNQWSLPATATAKLR